MSCTLPPRMSDGGRVQDKTTGCCWKHGGGVRCVKDSCLSGHRSPAAAQAAALKTRDGTDRGPSKPLGGWRRRCRRYNGGRCTWVAGSRTACGPLFGHTLFPLAFLVASSSRSEPKHDAQQFIVPTGPSTSWYSVKCSTCVSSDRLEPNETMSSEGNCLTSLFGRGSPRTRRVGVSRGRKRPTKTQWDATENT